MKTALILIDIQKGFSDESHWGGARNNALMEDNAAKLLAQWRELNAPIIHVQHASMSEQSPLYPEQKSFAFKNGFEPKMGEKHIIKHQNSAFIGTDLEAHLCNHDINDLVICGISTEHCVSTTTRMAGNMGFNVKLVGDACHAWPKKSIDGNTVISAQQIHETELAILNGEFATVCSTKSVIKDISA